MYIPLRVHSHYSFMDGLISPQRLVALAAEAGLPALALTDLGGLTGAVEFYDACLGVGVNPVLGLTIPVRLEPGGEALSPGAMDEVILLAQDLTGWGSLCRLSTSLQQQDSENPAITQFELERNTAGLICLLGGRNSLLAKGLLRGSAAEVDAYLHAYQGWFTGQAYVELQCQSREDGERAIALIGAARRNRMQFFASSAVHYEQPEQASMQRLVSAIRTNTPLRQLPAARSAPPGAHFADEAEMRRRLTMFIGNNIELAFETNQQIAERCQLTLPLGQRHYPDLDLPAKVSSIHLEMGSKLRHFSRPVDLVLAEKAYRGAQERYGQISTRIQERLDHELETITSMGYASLFLIMEDVLRFAKESGIPFSSRGSAASSLVAHCLGITTPDPMRLSLYFERFMNPVRASAPDIDTDLCSRRRDEVIQYVYQRYGAERVAMVCTINTFQRKSAFREVAKAYGLPQEQIKTISGRLPWRGWSSPGQEQTAAFPFGDLPERYPQYREVFDQAAKLIGLPTHLSIHPGGVVITPGPITDLAPLFLAAKGVQVTQFDLEGVARLGFVKIDLLGIRGLTVIGDVLGEARRSSGLGASRQGIEQAEDGEVSALIQSGRTIGCFQIESPGMRATLREIRASSQEDLMIAMSLYRPGPLTGGLKQAFVRRHLKLEAVDHLHPALEPLLGETKGIILYQEQVLQIAHEVAGLSLADADLLRRAMSHFDPGKQMQTLKDKFITGAQQRSQVEPQTSEQIWELMAAFAGYGFPKAHAASYAQVAWNSAWCKVHFPAHFMAAVLANWGGYYSQRIYLSEARRMGLVIRPPDVNYALQEFSAGHFSGKPALFMGLDQVKDLSRRTIQRILASRPYRSFGDFMTRVEPRPQEIERLIQCGALSDFGVIPRLLELLQQGTWRSGQLSLFDTSLSTVDDSTPEDWPLRRKLEAQQQILGVGVDAHPLELFTEQIQRAGAISTAEAALHPGTRQTLCGIRQLFRKGSSKTGKSIYYLVIEDLEGTLDIVIDGEIYQRWSALLRGDGPYVLEGGIDLNPTTGDAYMRLERVRALA